MPLDPISYSLAKKAKKIAENHALDSHIDVEITSPANGEVLTYDAINAVWKNAPPGEAEPAWLQLLNFRGIFWFNNHWYPSGMLPDVEGGSGAVSYSSDNLQLRTGTTSSSYAYVYKHIGPLPQPTWEKKRYFVCNVYMSDMNSNVIAYMIMGNAKYSSSASSDRHVGFKVVDGVLYGTVANGTFESHLELATLTSSERHELKVVFTPGVEARFYVDGEDKGAITTRLPSGTNYANKIFYASVYNKAAENKLLQVYQVKFVQEE